MKHLPLNKPVNLALLLFLTLHGCAYREGTAMNPSSWAAIFVVAAILLFFYYLFKFFRRK